LSGTLEAIRKLVAAGQVRISDHGYDEFAADGIFARDILAGVANAVVVTAYRPDRNRWDETFTKRRGQS
jgi:hypothetical protein